MSLKGFVKRKGLFGEEFFECWEYFGGLFFGYFFVEFVEYIYC